MDFVVGFICALVALVLMDYWHRRRQYRRERDEALRKLSSLRG